MDILTHIFLPLIFLSSIGFAGASKRYLLLLSPLAIFPDLDVFLGIHRGLFHSLLIIIPLTLLSFTLLNHARYISFFLSSHLFLDFLAGGVPFLYPLIETGVGVKFPLVIQFSSPPEIIEYLPTIVFSTPTPVHGQSYELFSGFGIALLFIFIAIYYKTNSVSSKNRENI